MCTGPMCPLQRNPGAALEQAAPIILDVKWDCKPGKIAFSAVAPSLISSSSPHFRGRFVQGSPETSTGNAAL